MRNTNFRRVSMNNKIKIMVVTLSMTLWGTSCNSEEKPTKTEHTSHSTNPESKKMLIQVILGSTRQNRTANKIAKFLKNTADIKSVDIEIIDLRDYTVPFLNDEIPPASRKEITDPQIKKWSDKINEADAFIMVVPEYNAGYPGVLKNALDTLYKEWNNKPVAFVGYSGGPSGGTSAVKQLREVTQALEMIPVSSDINIPSAWKSFDEKGNLTKKDITQEFKALIDQLMNAHLISKKIK